MLKIIEKRNRYIKVHIFERAHMLHIVSHITALCKYVSTSMYTATTHCCLKLGALFILNLNQEPAPLFQSHHWGARVSKSLVTTRKLSQHVLPCCFSQNHLHSLNSGSRAALLSGFGSGAWALRVRHLSRAWTASSVNVNMYLFIYCFFMFVI